MTAPMTAALAIGLVALTVPALLINLYFTLLILRRWPALRHRLGDLFTSCGADTSSCAVVRGSPERAHRHRLERRLARPRPVVADHRACPGAMAVSGRGGCQRAGR